MRSHFFWRAAVAAGVLSGAAASVVAQPPKQSSSQSVQSQPSAVDPALVQLPQLMQQAREAGDAARYPEAIRLYERVAALWMQQQNPQRAAVAKYFIGSFYYRLDRPEASLKALITAQQYAQTAKATELVQAIQAAQLLGYWALGKRDLDRRNYPQAMAQYRSALQVAKRVKNVQGQVTSLMQIAQIQRQQQFYREALEPLKKASDLFAQAKPQARNTPLFMLARTYDDLSNYPQALKLYNQLLDQAQKNNDQSEIASTLNNIGVLYQNQGEYKRSIALFNQALPITRKGQAQYAETVTVDNYQRICEADQRDQKTFTTYCSPLAGTQSAQALKRYQKTQIKRLNQFRQVFTVGRVKLEANLLNNLGVSHKELGDYKKALGFHQNALRLPGVAETPAIAGPAWNNAGNVYLSLGQYSQAEAAYRKSLEISQAAGVRDLAARSSSNLAQVYQAQGKFRQALKLSQASLKTVQSIGIRQDEATALNNIGTLHLNLAEYELAKGVLDQALAIYRDLNDPSGEATTLNNLALLAGQRGEPWLAIDLYQQAFKLSQQIGERSRVGSSLSNLGRAYADVSQYAKAIEHYQQALAIHQAVGDRSWELGTQVNLADMYNSLGQYDRSLALYRQVAKQAKAIGNPRIQGFALSGMGSVLMKQGTLEAAEESIAQAIALHRQTGAKRAEIYALRWLGNLRSRQGQIDQALQALNQALAIAQDVNLVMEQGLLLRNRAQVELDAGRYATAIATAQQAQPIAKQVSSRVMQGKLATIVGASQLALGQADRAQVALTQAVEIWEGLRPGLKDGDKVSLFDTQAQTYRLLQKSLVAQGKPEMALEVAERGRARAFVELFASRMGREKVVLESPKLAQMKALALQQNATLVEYALVSDRELYIWVIQPDGTVTFKSQKIDQQVASIQQVVAQTRSSIGVRSRASITTVNLSRVPSERAGAAPHTPIAQDGFRVLHKILIEPIAAQLPSNPNQSVVFMPQGVLFYVPFAALEDAAGKVLLEKHTIAVAPSIQALGLTAQLKRQLPQSGATLIVGNPTMPQFEDLQLSQLPGSEQEAKAVGQLLKVSPLLGGAATKARVMQQMQRSRIVHLATHGLLDSFGGDVPGAIVLAGGKTAQEQTIQSSLLSAGEIAQMQMQADLVVLSACSTGQGDV
ncbi:CHAT domain-containing tetratricopeptide repeat protein, partial [Romeriopsis navalis]